MSRLTLALLILCASTAAHAALDGRRLHFADGRLRDQRGREVTLRGVNARAQGIFDDTFDDGRLPLEPIPVFDAGDAERMQSLGFNLLRLPISWSALEPTPGAYDRSYLDRIAAVVDACTRRGILVIIDFHQDAFSKEIGQDGAPRWVLDLLLGPGNYPYLGGPLDDLTARRFAPATIAAFHDFFADQAGIQERFAAAAVAVAKRFRRARGVLGYELMNEPFVLAAGGTQAQLDDFHVRVATAIRRVDRRHLIVFEPDTIRNLTNQAPLPAAPFPVPGALYAPHIYTGVFDGLDFSSGNPALLAPSMERAANEAAAWGTPLLVGEYGIDPTSPVANRWITAELDLQDRLRAHSTFWLWKEISWRLLGTLRRESADGGERHEPHPRPIACLRARGARHGDRAHLRRRGEHAAAALPGARPRPARALRAASPIPRRRGAALRRPDDPGEARPQGRHRDGALRARRRRASRGAGARSVRVLPRPACHEPHYLDMRSRFQRYPGGSRRAGPAPRTRQGAVRVLQVA